MKRFCLTIDDNIRFLKELSEQERDSLFDHPYLAMLRRLHERFGAKIQLNLFYRMEGFDLADMSGGYAAEWAENADWLKLSFHSEWENERPYETAGYDEVRSHCRAVHEQILRFAGPASLGETTTLHYCRTTDEGLRALSDSGVRGLLGLFGSDESPKTSYGLSQDEASAARAGCLVSAKGMSFAGIDMVVNTVSLSDVVPQLSERLGRERVCVMIHEQYFYEDYAAYQPDYEQKLTVALELLCRSGYEGRFFEELI